MSQPPIRLIRPSVSDVRTDGELRAGIDDTSPHVPPTDDQVIDALAAHNGVPARVAAVLGVTEDYVLRIASRNARVLSTRLRSRLMLSSFATLLKIDAVLQASIDEMPTDAVGRTYAATLGAFTQLAGQFEEQEVQDDSDDAGVAKLTMLERLEKIDKRERERDAVEKSETG